MARQPLIGIWWNSGQHLAIFAHPWGENASGQTIRDSNLQHTDLWCQAARGLGISSTREYFDIPRGRVLFDRTKEQGIILHGNATSPIRLKKIARLFQLKEWTSRLDEHYLTGSILNDLFTDFDDSGDE